MNFRDYKYLKPSDKYKYVMIYISKLDKSLMYKAIFSKTNTTSGSSKNYSTEREAAIAVDIFRINKQLKPLNILKPLVG